MSLRYNFPVVILKSGSEIKNHCTLEDVSGQIPAVIPKFTPSNQESLQEVAHLQHAPSTDSTAHMLLHILYTSLSTRSISRHAHRPSPHHPPHRTSDGRRGIYAMTPTATCSTWRDIRTMPTCLKPHWISDTTVQRGCATPTIPTEISPAIRSALKSAIICLTWHRKSSAMARRRVRTAPLLIAAEWMYHPYHFEMYQS